MARGDKSKYTDKQKRKAEHIEERLRGSRRSRRGSGAPGLGYREQGIRRRQQVGSGRGKPDTHVSSEKGGRIGGAVGRPARG